MTKKLILASASPRRRALMSELGWEFEVVPSKYKEIRLDGETADNMALRFALGKAKSVAECYNNAVVVAADTIVVIDSDILGKPKDSKQVCEMLAKLQGRTHKVLTAVAVISEGAEVTSVETTKVTFRSLSTEQINAYVATGESLDKAGGYAIQGHGMLLVEKIDGSYSNVVGLPVACLSKILEKVGFTLCEQWGSKIEA